MTSGSVAVASVEARAFERRDPASACDPAFLKTIRYTFEDGAEEWDSTYEIPAAISALNRWTAMRNGSGAPLLNVVQDSPHDNHEPNVILRRQSSDGTASNAQVCSTPRVINVHSPAATAIVPGSLLTAIVHESGHIRRLRHVGKGETKMWNGQADVTREPRMTGCAPGITYPHSEFPESDDWAQVLAKQLDNHMPLGQYNPDSGFETYPESASQDATRSLRMWAGVASIEEDGTNAYAQVGTTPLKQIIRINNPPPALAFKARYKTASATSSSSFKMQYRRLSYPVGEPCGTPPANFFDVNSPSFVDSATAWVTIASANISASTNWVNLPRFRGEPLVGEQFGQGIDVMLLAQDLDNADGSLFVDNFVGEMSI